tara:strand:- start:471 stop:662 length:192 start_codon:yes stop_codon:yes gene_type:complete
MDERKELSDFQRAHVDFLKQQLRELTDKKNQSNKPIGVEREFFSADMELREYVKMLRSNGYKI